MNIETSFCLPNKCAEHYWEGLEARHNGQCLAVLRDYRTFRQMLCYRGPFSRRPSISSPASQAPVRELLTHIHNDPIHLLTPSVPCLSRRPSVLAASRAAPVGQDWTKRGATTPDPVTGWTRHSRHPPPSGENPEGVRLSPWEIFAPLRPEPLIGQKVLVEDLLQGEGALGGERGFLQAGLLGGAQEGVFVGVVPDLGCAGYQTGVVAERPQDLSAVRREREVPAAPAPVGSTATGASGSTTRQTAE